MIKIYLARMLITLGPLLLIGGVLFGFGGYWSIGLACFAGSIVLTGAGAVLAEKIGVDDLPKGER